VERATGVSGGAALLAALFRLVKIVATIFICRSLMIWAPFLSAADKWTSLVKIAKE
jgi:hypothetical protein